MESRDAKRQLEALLKVRSSFILIRDYLAMSPIESDQLLSAQLAEWVVSMDRRYGDIEFWLKSTQ